MQVWIATIILVLVIIGVWLFLKRDPGRYISDKKSPLSFFFRWGHPYHYLFKIAVIILFMIAIFVFYRYFLTASNVFAIIAAVIAGIVLSGGKELLDRRFSLDDIIATILAIIIGLTIIILFLR